MNLLQSPSNGNNPLGLGHAKPEDTDFLVVVVGLVVVVAVVVVVVVVVGLDGALEDDKHADHQLCISNLILKYR